MHYILTKTMPNFMIFVMVILSQAWPFILWQFFLGNMENKFLPGILVILCIISNFSMFVYGHFLVKYYT